MNVFIIDYENMLSCAPFYGVHALKSADVVHVFYSDSAKKINEYYWHELNNSHCKKNFYKLKHPGKNALDFCIAMQVGKSFSNKHCDNIVIISSDKGYRALKEYYPNIVQSENQKLILANNIAEGLTIINLDGELQSRAIREMASNVNIETMLSRDSAADRKTDQVLH